MIIATGYNGSSRGKENCCDKGICHRLTLSSNSGDYALCHLVHAEQNAIISALRVDMLGAVMYLLEKSMTQVYMVLLVSTLINV